MQLPPLKTCSLSVPAQLYCRPLKFPFCTQLRTTAPHQFLQSDWPANLMELTFYPRICRRILLSLLETIRMVGGHPRHVSLPLMFLGKANVELNHRPWELIRLISVKFSPVFGHPTKLSIVFSLVSISVTKFILTYRILLLIREN